MKTETSVKSRRVLSLWFMVISRAALNDCVSLAGLGVYRPFLKPGVKAVGQGLSKISRRPQVRLEAPAPNRRPPAPRALSWPTAMNIVAWGNSPGEGQQFP